MALSDQLAAYIDSLKDGQIRYTLLCSSPHGSPYWAGVWSWGFGEGLDFGHALAAFLPSLY
jgi:hypothetical protein